MKSQLFRKQMVERRAFGVWMLMIGWKKSELDLGDVETGVNEEMVRDCMRS